MKKGNIIMKKIIKCCWPGNWFTSTKPTVAILPLSGVIGKEVGFKKGMTLEGLEKMIDRAFKLPNLKIVALSINSPGGSPVQSELIFNYIRKHAEQKNIPVYSFVEDVAASGGYWLACAGDKIYASRSSIVGSIGVIAAGFGFHEAIKKLGIERRIYKQGENKSILDPFSKERAEEVAIVTKAQKQIHDYFKDIVKERRKSAIDPEKEPLLFSGEFWAGNDAKSLGLIDEIGTLYEVIEAMLGEKVNYERLSQPKGFLKGKFGLTAPNLVEECINTAEERLMWARYR